MSRFSGIGASEHPRAMALLTCDRIIVEANTGKKSLIDIFDNLMFPQLPMGLLRMSVFISLVRGESDTRHFSLGLFAPSGQALVGSTMEIAEWGTAGQADFVLEFNGVPFTEEGVYDLRLFVAEHVLAQRPIAVQKRPEPPAEPADSPTP